MRTWKNANDHRRISVPEMREMLLANFRYEGGKLYYLNGRPRPTKTMPLGYQILSLNGFRILEHNAIWLMFNEEFPEGYVIDHWSTVVSDNRIENLRMCKQGENARNSSKPKGAYSSKYKGVSWCKRGQHWVAGIMFNRKRIWLCGKGKTERECAIAYNEAAVKYFGEFAKLNIIEGENDKT